MNRNKNTVKPAVEQLVEQPVTLKKRNICTKRGTLIILYLITFVMSRS